MKYILAFIVGVGLTLFTIDYIDTKVELTQSIDAVNRMAYRCSQALFDDDEDWNEYSLSICQDMIDLSIKVRELEDKIKDAI